MASVSDCGWRRQVGRTCSEHKRREHERAFLDTVLCTKGSRVSLGAVQGEDEESENGD